MPSLSSTFSEMLPVSLKDFQAAEVSVSLPRIVVIGDESVGKSSVLERIAQAPLFPRDEDFCTRMPFVLKLRHGAEQDIHVCCRTRGGAVLRNATGGAIEEFIQQDGNMQERLESLGNRIKASMRDIIQAATAQAAPADERSILTDHVMEINIQSPHVQSVELIDLPGLVQDGARQQALQLIQEYLNDRQNTLVVCVVSDQLSSLRNNSTLSEVWQRPYLHSRTVVALTHVDMTTDNFGADPRRLVMRVNAYNLGFDFRPHSVVPLINWRRDGESFEAAVEHERSRFNDVNATLDKAGLPDLIDVLARLAERHLIHHWLPMQMTEIWQKVVGHDQSLEAMGQPPNSMMVCDLAETLRSRLQRAEPSLQHYGITLSIMASSTAAFSQARTRAENCEHLLTVMNNLRDPKAIANAAVRIACQAVQPSHAPQLHRIDFSPLLQEFQPPIPDQKDLRLVIQSMLRRTNFQEELLKALYDWLIVPLISYLEGGWVAAFQASDTQAPVLCETEKHAMERQSQTEMRDLRRALHARLSEWSLARLSEWGETLQNKTHSAAAFPSGKIGPAFRS